MQRFHSLGKPDLTLGGLRLWIHGREFPDSTDYYDLNWLVISAICEARGARVWLERAPALMTEELQRWLHALEQLLQGKRRRAALDPMEPYLNITVRDARPHGVWEVEVCLPPDNVNQQHRFRFEVSGEELNRLVQQLRGILERYPVVGER